MNHKYTLFIVTGKGKRGEGEGKVAIMQISFGKDLDPVQFVYCCSRSLHLHSAPGHLDNKDTLGCWYHHLIIQHYHPLQTYHQTCSTESLLNTVQLDPQHAHWQTTFNMNNNSSSNHQHRSISKLCAQTPALLFLCP